MHHCNNKNNHQHYQYHFYFTLLHNPIIVLIYITIMVILSLPRTFLFPIHIKKIYQKIIKRNKKISNRSKKHKKFTFNMNIMFFNGNTSICTNGKRRWDKYHFIIIILNCIINVPVIIIK